MTLKGGQVVKYAGDLYRVDFINACRMRLVPLSKKQVALDDDGSPNSASRGISISAGACVEVVTDIERARDQIELQQAERALAAARSEIRQEATLRDELEDAEAALAALRASTASAPRPAPRRDVRAGAATGWHPGPEPWPAFKAGTLAHAVMTEIVTRPGQSTAEVVAAVAVEGAVAACVSRFSQAGYIHRA